jgi:hypothetical protein
MIDLSKQLKQYSARLKHAEPELKLGIEQNAIEACKAAELVIKAHTPHSNDGKQRGFNVISDSLYHAWQVRYTPVEGKEFGIITFENSQPYARFVQDGHRVSKHFVPWLYRDGAVLSYETNHNQPLFGLVVGTKTPFVKGVDMLGPGEKEFQKVFALLNAKLFEKTLR